MEASSTGAPMAAVSLLFFLCVGWEEDK
uniref:Uncharacterized protein n=1 Tax=Arundo donax TaxID=35708 RepID=A0A0A9CD33_ARUDO